jgi:hypothetical protein
MTLPLRERRALKRIGKGIDRSDPRLAKMYSAFGSFNSGERMPSPEQFRILAILFRSGRPSRARILMCTS